MILLLPIIRSICICHWYTHGTDCYTSLTNCRHVNNDTVRALNLAVIRCAGLAFTCKVKMMWLCHDWGWQPPQTASHIHLRHIQSDWAHWYAINGHTVLALHSYTHPTWLTFWGSGSLVESKWWDCVVEADGHLELLPTSILDIYTMFEHIDMLYIGIIPTLIGSYSGVLGHLWSQMMWLCHGWGWQPPQIASHIHIRHIQRVWAHWYAIHRHMVAALHSYTHPIWLIFGGSGSLVESNDVIMSWLRLIATSNCFQHPY